MKTLLEKTNAVLATVYRGIHNVPGKIVIAPPKDGHIYVNAYGGLSTTDHDQLTRLVIAAHDHCVRVEIKPCNPQLLRLIFTNRLRGGDNMESHPTIEQRLATFRQSHPAPTE